ncbi:MAG: tRNA lysidine(34) synthetase TilS [Eggerthellaceae bacterium]|jgi:tRNA(Ile)-lysidine synthase|nr:tRNA lysidine(34) synthetase TilS [Eggerthellaceae bacterium]
MHERHLADRDTPLVLMVSGGSDSTGLTYIMADLQQRDIVGPISVLHVNHHIRGEASDIDARFVRDLCSDLHLSFALCDVDIPALVAQRGSNMEAVARQERYAAARQALKDLCLDADCPLSSGRIVTAHTQNDRVENFYMRSIVGTGPGGFRSMLYQNGPVIRPLLDVSKDDVRLLIDDRVRRSQSDGHVVVRLDDQGNSWREDATNAHTDHFRAYVRHEMVPLAVKRNPQVLDTLCRSMNLIADEDDMIDGHVSDLMDPMITWFAQSSPVRDDICTAVAEDDRPISAEDNQDTSSDQSRTGANIGGTKADIDYRQGCLVAPAFALQPVPIRRRIAHKILQMIQGLDARIETASIDSIVYACADGRPISGYVENIQGDLAISANKKGIRIEPMNAYRIRRKRV